MSVEGLRSGSKTPPKKRSYPLKMETIPMSSSYSELKDLGGSEMDHHDETGTKSHRNRHVKEDAYDPVEPDVSSYERDDDFKFKRHKTKPLNGIPSLGERLDNLQDLKKAKWMENFNSSMPQNGEEHVRGNRGLSSPIHSSSQENQFSQPSQMQQQPAYMPYMYYYPMPTPGHPLMSYMGSPVHPSQLDAAQYMNSSVSMMPNTSLQPFMPPPPVPNSTGPNNDVPQLLPPPPLYPYNFLHQQQQQQQQQQEYIKKSNDRRRSTAFNRGRRLSMLASQDDHNLIVSPHKDVPEEDFYRHIGNTSFGKSLQIRQLFNWCMIRSLRNMENEGSDEKSNSELRRGEFVDPKKIAMIIIGEFVNDLRKSAVDIDWEAEETSSIDENEFIEDEEDTELRELFNDDDDDYDNNVIKKSSKPRSARKRGSERIKIANSKNVANEKNLNSLQERIDDIEKEISDWARVLDNSEAGTEWKHFTRQLKSSLGHEESFHDEPVTENIQEEITRKMNKLYVHSHLLQSSSQAISQIASHKLNILSQKFVPTIHDDDANKQLDAKTLLRGLSKSLLD